MILCCVARLFHLVSAYRVWSGLPSPGLSRLVGALVILT